MHEIVSCSVCGGSIHPEFADRHGRCPQCQPPPIQVFRRPSPPVSHHCSHPRWIPGFKQYGLGNGFCLDCQKTIPLYVIMNHYRHLLDQAAEEFQKYLADLPT